MRRCGGDPVLGTGHLDDHDQRGHELGGIYFVCGLPGWSIVRWAFNFLNKRKDKDLAEIAAEVVDDARKIAAGGTNV